MDNKNEFDLKKNNSEQPGSKSFHWSSYFPVIKALILKILYFITYPLQYIEPILLPLLLRPEKIGIIMEIIFCGNFFLAMGIPGSLKEIVMEIVLIFFLLIPIASTLYLFMHYMGFAITKTLVVIGRYGTEWHYSIGKKTVEGKQYSEEEIAQARQIFQLFGKFRVGDLNQKRRKLLNEISSGFKKENIEKAKAINKAYGILFTLIVLEKRHIEVNQDSILKVLYYLTRPFVFIEEMLYPILEDRDIILGSIDMLIYAFAFSFFMNNVKGEDAAVGFVFLLITFAIVIVLQIATSFFAAVGTIFLTMLINICSRMVEFNLMIKIKIWGYKGFDNYDYYHYEQYTGDEEKYYEEDSNDYNQKQEYREEAYRSEEEKARKIFGLYGDFTVDELKSARRNLIRKNHPDQGGSEERAKEINAAYDILFPLAKKVK